MFIVEKLMTISNILRLSDKNVIFFKNNMIFIEIFDVHSKLTSKINDLCENKIFESDITYIKLSE